MKNTDIVNNLLISLQLARDEAVKDGAMPDVVEAIEYIGWGIAKQFGYEFIKVQ